MINVSRKRVRAPQRLTKAAPRAYALLRKHFQKPEADRLQRRAPFHPELWDSEEVVEALSRLFENRCAFCETPLDSPRSRVATHFRPIERARGIGQHTTVAPQHYWWLAYEWSNLYLTCWECGEHHNTRFPVRGRRAAPEQSVAAEKRELLDPCSDDPIARELVFEPNGRVFARSPRAEKTIEVFGLNRPSLVQLRLAQTQRVRDAQRTRRPLESLRSFGFLAHTAQVAQGRRAPRLESKVKSSSSVWLQKVEIHNFRPIEDVTLTFPEHGKSGQQPWLMLLGENGVGKSSILKAIALALMDRATRKDTVADARTCVRQGQTQGHVRVWFNVDADPLTLHFKKSNRNFVISGDPPRHLVLAYGSTRMLPPPATRRSRPSRNFLGNLFDARVNLRDAEPWLLSPKAVSNPRFQTLALGLKTVLCLDDKAIWLFRNKQAVLARFHRHTVPLRQLSDGYQSVLAFATDIMLTLSRSSFDMRQVEGTVLLDELEVHLHPTWKRRIVTALRTTFPRVRFIVTTHDPLCLHGLEPGELHVLTRDKDKRVSAAQHDVPSGYSADQVLTGEWFELGSTRDPTTLRDMEKYSVLVNKTKKSAADRKDVDRLGLELRQKLPGFADLSIERLALGVAAELMKKAGKKPEDLTLAERQRIRAKIKQRLEAATA